MPIGKPEVVLKNLDEWGSDEIILIDNDSSNIMQPNIRLLQNIANLKVRTPLVYGGGIKNEKDAVQCIKNGADRVLVNQIYFDNINQISKISEVIGKESLILNLNFSFFNNRLNIFNYKTLNQYSIPHEELLPKDNDYYLFLKYLVDNNDNLSHADVWAYENKKKPWQDKYSNQYLKHINNKVSSNMFYRKTIDNNRTLNVTSKTSWPNVKDFFEGLLNES